MISMTLCLGNGPWKLTGLMGPRPRDNSRCLQGDPNARSGVLEWLGSSKDDQERGRGQEQAARGEALVVGEEGPRMAMDDVGLLPQLRHCLPWTSTSTFPSLSFRIYKREVIIAPRQGHFFFFTTCPHSPIFSTSSNGHLNIMMLNPFQLIMIVYPSFQGNT